jgi:hypothetical protein
MKKRFAFFILSIVPFLTFAQDDYVITEQIQEKPQSRVFSGLPNPDFTNYTFTASAYTLHKRDFRFSNTDIFFLKGSYGLSNKTMVSLNLSALGTFIGSVKHKININDGMDLGLTASMGQALMIPGDSLAEDSIINSVGGQAVISLGDHQNNISGGYGFYYAESNYDMIDGDRSLYLNNFFVAVQKQISPKTYLMAEGMYFLNYNSFVGSIAFKFIIKTRWSLVAGLMPVFRNGRIGPNRTSFEGGVIPVIALRLYLDRH